MLARDEITAKSLFTLTHAIGISILLRKYKQLCVDYNICKLQQWIFIFFCWFKQQITDSSCKYCFNFPHSIAGFHFVPHFCKELLFISLKNVLFQSSDCGLYLRRSRGQSLSRSITCELEIANLF